MRYHCLTMGSKPASGELTKALLPLFKQFCKAHVINDINVGTDNIRELKNWRGQTYTKQRKIYFCKTGDTISGFSHTKRWNKTWSCKSWSIKPCRSTRKHRGCMLFLCMMRSLSDFITNLSQRHSIWDNWQRNMYIFTEISEMLCIRTSYWHFSNHNNQHFYMLMYI